MPPTPANAPRDVTAAAMERPRRLTEIPGGSTNRLPIAVRPLEDEPPSSWAVRLAHRYGLTVRSMLDSLDVPAASWTLGNFPAALTPHHPRILDALGLPGGPLFRPSSEGKAVTALVDEWFARYRPRQTREPRGTRYCPRCLADRDGGWKELWQQPLSMICIEHNVPLNSRCPKCAGRPWTSGAWLSSDRPAWECARLLRGIQHGHRRRIPRCGQDLRDAETVEPERADQLVRAQRLLYDIAGIGHVKPTQDDQFLGQPFTYRDAFFALLELLDAGSGRGSHPFSLETDPIAQLNLVLPRLAVLLASDAASAAPKLAALITPNGRHAPQYVVRNLRHHEHNPLLEHIVLSTTGPTMSPTLQLTFRTANARPRYPHTAQRDPSLPLTARDGELPMSAIPQRLWAGAIPAHVSGNQDAPVVDAMLLARVGTVRTWQHIAVALGLPASFRGRPPARLNRLRRSGQWPELLAALDNLAIELEARPPPIDYQQRRLVCADPAVLLRLTTRVVASRPPPEQPRTTLQWAQLFWQVYTGGDLRLAPELLRTPSGAPRPSMTDADIETLQHIRWLIEHRLGLDDAGPLSWVPP